MLAHIKSRVAVPSFLFAVGTVTGVVVASLRFLRLTGLLLHISLKHGLHEGHALIAPRLLVGLLRLRGLTFCCLEGLTIVVIVMAVQGVVGLEGTAMGLATLANFSLQPYLGTRPVGPPDALRFGLPLALDGAVPPFPFALRFVPFFSTMTCLMASRSGSNIQVELGTA
jgi:hypothetical protein